MNISIRIVLIVTISEGSFGMLIGTVYGVKFWIRNQFLNSSWLLEEEVGAFEILQSGILGEQDPKFSFPLLYLGLLLFGGICISNSGNFLSLKT